MLLKHVDPEIRRKIDKILALYNQTKAGIPVNLEILIASTERITGKKIEIKYYYLKNDQWSGYLVYDRLSSRVRIFVNGYYHHDIQRITLAHEIAHLLFFHTGEKYSGNKPNPKNFPDILEDCLKKATKEKEEIFDEIAWHFLCPSVEVEEFLRKNRSEEMVIRLKTMSETFKVPTDFFVKYLKKCNLITEKLDTFLID